MYDCGRRCTVSDRGLAALRQLGCSPSSSIFAKVRMMADDCPRCVLQVTLLSAGEVPKALFLEQPSPLSFAKSIKNEAELAGMREAHLRDAVALAETLHHLEQEACPSHMPSSFTREAPSQETLGKTAPSPSHMPLSFTREASQSRDF